MCTPLFLIVVRGVPCLTTSAPKEFPSRTKLIHVLKLRLVLVTQGRRLTLNTPPQGLILIAKALAVKGRQQIGSRCNYKAPVAPHAL
jgi:hypothetical protein